ncbi:MAG: dTDP-4-dehydrorhamnose 3,5-epimerase family protein [Candidatus Paceibacterota bacterium]|jgi:dTDP-4-dehydrorhamnose 3,5-epimerase
MKISPTKLKGVFVIETDFSEDERGSFSKTFHADIFKKYKLSRNFKESFFSISNKNVIRGMHFHLPPRDHAKLIYVTHGAILDVVLDLRKDSKTYGDYVSVELSQKNHKGIYIPTGCAHGFLSLEDSTCTVYLQTSMYSKEHDTGVNIGSFGMKWGVKNPVISKRDKGLMAFKDFVSPFNKTK